MGGGGGGHNSELGVTARQYDSASIFRIENIAITYVSTNSPAELRFSLCSGVGTAAAVAYTFGPG